MRTGILADIVGLPATLVTVLVAAHVLAATPSQAWAHAQTGVLAPSPEEIERARVLDENARQLYDEGAYEGAILAWKKAHELTEYNNLLYNISMAYDRAGDFEKALEYLDRYRALASPEERAQLERKKKSLKARLDKQKKDAEAAAAAAETGEPTEDVPPPPPDPATDDTTTPESKPPRLFTPAAWALTGVGALGFGLGIGFGAASLTATRGAEGGCTDSLCSTDVKSEVQRARQNAIVADVGIAIGAACTIAVVALVAVQAKKRKHARGTALAPMLMPGGAGVGVAARF